MSVLVVTEQDWERLRTMSMKMGNMFDQEVAFDWEGVNDNHIALDSLEEQPLTSDDEFEEDESDDEGEPYGKILM